jgi:hypothetical protein
VETDLRSGSAIRMDKTGKSILMLLRHLGRLQEVSRAQGGSCCKADCQMQGQIGVEPKPQCSLSPSNMMVRQLVYVHGVDEMLRCVCMLLPCWHMAPADTTQGYGRYLLLHAGPRYAGVLRLSVSVCVAATSTVVTKARTALVSLLQGAACTPTAYVLHSTTANSSCMAVASVHWHSTVSCFSCCWPCFLLRL